MKSLRSALKNTFLAIVALTLAGAIWLPCVHFFFKPHLQDYRSSSGLSSKAQRLAAYQLRLWSDPAGRAREIGKMRNSNAEWDFMGRTYLVLALANMGLREPRKKADYLDIMDHIIEETIRLEKDKGLYYFLMDYARIGAFIAKPPRSLFQDGEIALMLASRRMLEECEKYQPLLKERVDLMTAQMRQSPVLCGESYPNECWMFCNAVALTTLRMADVLDGTDHSDFIRQWLETARRNLTDAKTGLLLSSFSMDGIPGDGPEGSSIWMVAHCLQTIDPAFAADLYRRAKLELAGNFLGFGYAREWPKRWKGMMDVDSGPIIPFLEISAGSSGLAILAASAFDDDDYLSALLTSLNFGGFPLQKNEQLRFCASNQVGDAVLLYALVQGPLWREVERRGKERP
jgi:hypothetical protein